MDSRPNTHTAIFSFPNGAIVRLAIRIDAVEGDNVKATWWRIGEADPRAFAMEVALAMPDLIDEAVRDIVCGREPATGSQTS